MPKEKVRGGCCLEVKTYLADVSVPVKFLLERKKIYDED